MTGMESTLLRPVVNDYDARTRIGKTALARVLIDGGNHVEWHDGGLVERWTLPDQPREVGTPVVTSLVVADTWFMTWSVNVPESYVLLADEDGRTLAVLALITTAAGPTYVQVDFDRVWPQGSFDQLMSRGVTWVEESHPDLRALNRAHPGAVARWRLIVGTRASQWVVGGLFGVAFLVVGVRLLGDSARRWRLQALAAYRMPGAGDQRRRTGRRPQPVDDGSAKVVATVQISPA